MPAEESELRATDEPDATTTSGHSRSATVHQTFLTRTDVPARRAKWTITIFQAGSPQAPEVSDHGLLEKLEDDEEEKDRSNNIQRCTAGVAPSRIPLVARCRPSRPERLPPSASLSGAVDSEADQDTGQDEQCAHSSSLPPFCPEVST